jgi:hypothetical protein
MHSLGQHHFLSASVRMRGRTKFALLGPYPSFGTLLEHVGPDSQVPVNLLYFHTGPTRYISPTFLLAGRCPSQCTAGRKVRYQERHPVNSTTPHPVPPGAASLVRQQGTEQRGVSKAPNLVHVLLPRVLSVRFTESDYGICSNTWTTVFSLTAGVLKDNSIFLGSA